LLGSNWLGYSYDRNQKGFNTQDVAPGESVGVPSYSGSDKVSHSSYDTWGFYAQDLMTLHEQWQLLAGLRFDRKVANGVAEENVAPKLGVIFHPADNGSIYASYSESFEPQGVVSSGKRTYTNDGELLDAATGVSYEVGTKWELFDQALFVSGALFDITQQNVAMDVEDANNSGNYIKSQEGEQQHRGAELTAQGSVTEKLSLSGSAMYLDAEITQHETYAGNRPVDVPEFAASVWSSYAATNEIDVNLGVIYQGSRYGDEANTFKKEGYTRVDMGLAYTYKYDANLDMVARLSVENLFDTDYLAGGGSTSSGNNYAEGVVVGEGRNYMATLQIKY
jgi:iron complex outermembrane receptor protein